MSDPARGSFSIGDLIEITHLRKRGTVTETLSGGRYRVAVGNLIVTCEGRALRIVSAVAPGGERQAKRSKDIAIPPKVVHQLTSRQKTPARSLDLHGLRASDALSKLSGFLDAAILAGFDKVTIIHGHGTGKLQTTVHEYLKSLPVVERYKVNELNTGETIVYL